jgi:hypothetical protein
MPLWITSVSQGTKNMKITLSSGATAFVKLKHGPKILRSGVMRKATNITVEMPDGSVLTGEAVCREEDPFIKAVGRKLAFLNLLRADSLSALDKVLKAQSIGDKEMFSGETKVIAPVKSENGKSLDDLARDHYQLSRIDRSNICRIVCPDIYSPPSGKRTAYMKALRKAKEITTLKRLYEKYGPPKEETSAEEKSVA